MIDAGLADQKILAFFSQPGRDFNHNKISALRSTDRSQLPSAATHAELQDFLDSWIVPQRLPDPCKFWDTSGINAGFWRFVYRFHPVGQGMLHSGMLQQGHRPPFRWVYDCGSLTSQTLIETELGRLCEARGVPKSEKPPLDLVALSHFDKDHVSGIVHLLGLFKVKLILLPFLTFWQRLWIAAAMEELDAEFLQFLLDPTGYLLKAAGEELTRIVFVPPSGGDAPPAPAAPPDGPADGVARGEMDDRPMKLRLATGSAPVGTRDEIAGVTGQRLSAAEFLKAESVLDIDGLWEFVPYNDAKQAEQCPAEFPRSVAPLVKALLDATSPPERKTAFEALKAHYDATFGSSGYHRNVISLFLYGGPVPPPADARFWTGHLIHQGDHYSVVHDRTTLVASHFAMLFTGDGFLNSKPRRTAFETFFSAYDRLGKTSVFQVMHHGASGNSSAEVAPLVAPRVSVFCSDPLKGEQHPDADVLRQFWPYNCIQVDDTSGWIALGVFDF